MPRGFAHGFVVLEEDTVFAYKVDNYYSPQNDRGIAFNDPALGINWIIDQSLLKLSAKDTRQPFLDEADTFNIDHNLYE